MLEQMLETHLSWLSDAQKEQIRAMNAEGKPVTEMRKQVMEWYEQLEGEAHDKAKELMQGG